MYITWGEDLTKYYLVDMKLSETAPCCVVTSSSGKDLVHTVIIFYVFAAKF